MRRGARLRARAAAAAAALLALLALVRVVGVAGRRVPFEGTHLEMRPVLLRACPGVANNALSEMDINFEYRGRTTVVVLVNATLTRSVDKWKKVKIMIEKCSDAVSLSSCQTYKSLEFSNNVCGLMMSPAMPWAQAVADVRPKMSCPAKKGEYTLRNGSLSMDMINAASSTLQLEGSVWRARCSTYDGAGASHMCVDLAGEFFRVRNRPSTSQPPGPPGPSGPPGAGKPG